MTVILGVMDVAPVKPNKTSHCAPPPRGGGRNATVSRPTSRRRPPPPGRLEVRLIVDDVHQAPTAGASRDAGCITETIKRWIGESTVCTYMTVISG